MQKPETAGQAGHVLKACPAVPPRLGENSHKCGTKQTCRSSTSQPEKTMKPYIVTAPNGEQTLVYQTKDGRIKAERINPVEPSSRRQKTLAVNIPYRGSKGPLHLLIPSRDITS